MVFPSQEREEEIMAASTEHSSSIVPTKASKDLLMCHKTFVMFEPFTHANGVGEVPHSQVRLLIRGANHSHAGGRLTACHTALTLINLMFSQGGLLFPPYPI